MKPITVTVVVNGWPTAIASYSNYESVGSIMARAIAQTGNLQYGPLDKWEARDRLGKLIAQDLAWHWVEPTSVHGKTAGKTAYDRTIFFNLKPGVGA